MSLRSLFAHSWDNTRITNRKDILLYLQINFCKHPSPFLNNGHLTFYWSHCNFLRHSNVAFVSTIPWPINSLERLGMCEPFEPEDSVTGLHFNTPKAFYPVRRYPLHFRQNCTPTSRLSKKNIFTYLRTLQILTHILGRPLDSGSVLAIEPKSRGLKPDPRRCVFKGNGNP
jgi:hypothetical protein